MTVAVAIGIVMGGTQALSRSFFSLLIPRGREGEYFSLYNAAERGTSWFGTLLFGVVFQVTGSYRPAILALILLLRPRRVLPAPARPRAGHRGGRQPDPCVDRLSRGPDCWGSVGILTAPRSLKVSRSGYRLLRAWRRPDREAAVPTSVTTDLPRRLKGGTHEVRAC